MVQEGFIITKKPIKNNGIKSFYIIYKNKNKNVVKNFLYCLKNNKINNSIRKFSIIYKNVQKYNIFDTREAVLWACYQNFNQQYIASLQADETCHLDKNKVIKNI